MKLSPELTAQGPGPDHFGMIARARIELPAGRWRFSTLSDDGVRVRVDQQTVLENWTWHGPTRDSAEFEQSETREVDLVLEHFEIDGDAVLQGFAAAQPWSSDIVGALRPDNPVALVTAFAATFIGNRACLRRVSPPPRHSRGGRAD